MTLAWLSLGALVVAMIVSCFSTLNVGVLALALAWIVGVFIGGMRVEDVIGTFPVSLFLMLTGVTLLFSQDFYTGWFVLLMSTLLLLGAAIVVDKRWLGEQLARAWHADRPRIRMQIAVAALQTFR